MLKPKRFYILSNEADSDIDEIFDYTEKEFGFNQAEKYVLAFEEVFNHLLSNPYLGKERSEIKKELYSIVKSKHVVFYTITKNGIRIIRILHGSRDLPKQFKE